MEAFYKAQGLKGATLRTQLERLGLDDSNSGRQAAQEKTDTTATLALTDRAWSGPCMARPSMGTMGPCTTRADLERFYPTIHWQAYRRVPVGANGQMQELPSNDSTAQDQVALQEGQQTSPAQGRVEHRQNRSRVQHLERRRRRQSGRQRRTATRIPGRLARHHVPLWCYLRVLLVASDDAEDTTREQGENWPQGRATIGRRHNDCGSCRGPRKERVRSPAHRGKLNLPSLCRRVQQIHR